MDPTGRNAVARARTVTLYMPERLIASVRVRAGARGFSRYVTLAVEHKIAHDSLGCLLDELEAEYGRVPDEVRELTQRMWPGYEESGE